MKKIKLVIAGDMVEFLNWCAREGVNPNNYKYISSIKDIYGHKDCVIYRVRHYYRRDDLGEINSYCISHNIKNAYREG